MAFLESYMQNRDCPEEFKGNKKGRRKSKVLKKVGAIQIGGSFLFLTFLVKIFFPLSSNISWDGIFIIYFGKPKTLERRQKCQSDKLEWTYFCLLTPFNQNRMNLKILLLRVVYGS